MPKSSSDARQGVRADKFLWAVRLYKTRTDAADACKKGKISFNGSAVKSSHLFHEDDVFTLHRSGGMWGSGVTFSFRILSLTDKRVGAKIVSSLIEDLTPPEEYERLSLIRSGMLSVGMRERGTGRPTKKERRDLDAFLDADDFFDEE